MGWASRDGRVLATGFYDGKVRLWDVNTRQQIGDLLADPAENGTGILWDVASRTQIGAPLTNCAEVINSASFGLDGHILVTSTGARDTAVRWWDVPPMERIISILCARVGRSLTSDEWQRYIPELPYRQICP